MKILAVDDNAVARAVLKAFLEKSGYTPVIAEDGESALKIMQQPDAPQVVVLDWMMPGISGPALCSKLRSLGLSHRPYIILLTAKNDKADIATGLDAGADEFITKPFNQVEMLARLRAARRAVEYESELQQRIDELAALVERHKMLEDLIAKNGGSGQAGASAKSTKGDTAPQTPTLQLSTAEIDQAIRQGCAGLGWNEVAITAKPAEGPYTRPPMMAWSGFFVDPAEVWLDFILESEADTAALLFERSMRKRPANDRALLDYLAEILNLITLHAHSILEERDNTMIAPFLSRGLKLGSLSAALPIPPAPRETFAIAIGGATLGLTLLRHACPVKQKTAGQLNRADILAAPFQPSDAYQIPLLNRGTVLSERFVERLIAFARSEGVPLKLSVFEPSPVAIQLNPQRTERRPLGQDDF
ncbi:phosphate regulon transcriptional regulatory protein PhoB [mine drainage metagenome]|uniref:Phosphate regulon transcriptional regulatory protein PhoB n=1 Tax=mine drainage metagenome TaxID=410659 RepID=A0A1J5RMU9_9ZZZZ